MSRVMVPPKSRAADDVRPARSSAAGRPAAPGSVDALQRELTELRHEVVALRTQGQRDAATMRGLGEALQALRSGALTLRTENADLRRQLAARSPHRR